MRIKLDENLPTSLAEDLGALGHDTDTVSQQGLAGSKDRAVWSGAQKAGRLLITHDMDFSDLRLFEPGTHHGILLVRLREPTRRALIGRVRTLFETEDVASWQGCFVVATARKVRVRRPGQRPADGDADGGTRTPDSKN